MATIYLGPLSFNKTLTLSNYTITADNGNDLLVLYGNDDILQFGSGNDIITVYGNNETITAGSGNDIISIIGTSAIGKDTVTLGSGNNIVNISGIINQASVTVGNGHNFINITALGNGDIVKAGNGGNFIYAAGTNNSVTSAAGNDTLVYNPSNALEDGGGGFNTLLVTTTVPEIHFDGTVPLKFKNFQLIDLTGTGMANLSGFANTLDLSPSGVDQITGGGVNSFNGHQKTLVVLPSYSDHINIGSGWTNVTPLVETPLHATENLVINNIITPTPITLAEYRVYVRGQDTLIINEAPPLANPDTYGTIIEASGQHYPLTYSTGNILSNDQSMAGFAFSIKALDGIGLTNGYFFETLADGNTLKLNTNGTFVYTINNPINGSDVFHYTITDGILTSSPGAITFNVGDTRPIANDDSYNITEVAGQQYPLTYATGNVLSNDVHGGGLGFSVNAAFVTLADGNTLSLNADGTFVYKVNNPIHGSDVFNYTITDGLLTSSQATITFNVTDTSPIANADSYNITEVVGQQYPLTYTTGNVLSNDVHGGGLGFSVNAEFVTLADGNTLSLNADGTFIYTVNKPTNGSDVFQYTITDGLLTSSQASITFIVTDTPPVANDDNNYTLVQNGVDYILSENATNGVLANDTQGGGYPLKVVQSDGSDISNSGLVVSTAHGSVTLYSDGSMQYTNTIAFSGTDSFSYKISDGVLTSTATAKINVSDTVTPFINGFNGDNFFVPPPPIGTIGDGGIIIIPPTINISQYEFSENENQHSDTWQINMAPTVLTEPYTYSVNDARFSVSSTGLISQLVGIDENSVPLDQYGNHIITLAVTATDTLSLLSKTVNMTLNIADLDYDSTATLTSNDLTEGNQNNVVVATLSQTHSTGDDIYNTLVSVTDNNNNDVSQYFSLVNGQLKIDPVFVGIFGPIGGPLTTVYNYLNLDEGTYTYHVTVKDSENDPAISIPLTFTVYEASNEISLVSGANTQAVSYADSVSRAIFDVSTLFQDPYDPITYSSSDLPSGLSINSSTGVISGSLATAADYTVHVTASDGDTTPATLTTTIDLHVVPTFNITSNQQFKFMDDNFFYTNFVNNISDFSGSPVSVSLGSGMPGQILNYFDGTYAYLDWNLATDSTGIISSPKFVTGSMTVDNNIYPFALNVTDPGITLLNQDPTTLLQVTLTASSGTNGGNGGDGYNTGSGLETTTHAGSHGTTGVGGFSIESLDSNFNIVPYTVTSDEEIILMPNTGDAGNGGNGGTGAPGWSVFDSGASGGDGGNGGKGGSIIYTLDDSTITYDQIIIGGDTGNAGIGGINGSHGAAGATTGRNTLFPEFGGAGGDGGSGGVGGKITYTIKAGSGDDYIEVGTAGYSALNVSCHAANGVVTYNINGGSGHDYFVIDHLPTSEVFKVSETQVNIVGGSGDDVFDLKVAFFVNDSNSQGTISGECGTLNLTGGSGFNSLILDGTDANLNGLGANQPGITTGFTDNPTTVFNHIHNIDLVDLKGGSSIGLTAGQIDLITTADGNGMHTLFINSESPATDSVTFKHDPNFQGSGTVFSQNTENNTTYNVYHIDANTTLNIQANIAHVVIV
jgi:hypothetical protein